MGSLKTVEWTLSKYLMHCLSALPLKITTAVRWHLVLWKCYVAASADFFVIIQYFKSQIEQYS